MRIPHRRSILRFSFLVLSLLLLIACGSSSDSKIEVGSPIPSFKLTSLDGATVTNISLEGKPVVLNFWATWCGPCVKEIPTLKEISKNPEIEVVSVALDEEGEDLVRPFAQRHGIDYAVLLGDMELFQRFDGYAIPYTLVLDSSGLVVSIYRGLVRAKRLERDLQKAMAVQPE